MTPDTLTPTTRVLPPAEWPRVLADGIEPYASLGQLPDPAHTVLVAVEVEGRIMGVVTLYDTVNLDIWVRPEARRHLSVVGPLWRGAIEELRDRGIPRIHATVGDPEVQDFVERLGGLPAPGQLYLFDLRE